MQGSFKLRCIAYSRILNPAEKHLQSSFKLTWQFKTALLFIAETFFANIFAWLTLRGVFFFRGVTCPCEDESIDVSFDPSSISLDTPFKCVLKSWDIQSHLNEY